MLSIDTAFGTPSEPATRWLDAAPTPWEYPSQHLQQGWQLRYFDDFSNPESGWPVDDNLDRELSYFNGEYRIYVKTDQYFSLVGGGPSLMDAAIEVEIRHATATYGMYGLLFGITDDWSALHAFTVDERQNYWLWRWDETRNGFRLIRGPVFSAHLNPRQDVNLLRAERVGDQWSFYANGHLVTTERLQEITGGRRMGVIAWSRETPNVDIRFDNYKLFSRVASSPTPTSTEGPSPTATETPLATSSPTASPTATPSEVTPGELLFADDFRDVGSGWPVWEEDTSAGRYVDSDADGEHDEYHLYVDHDRFIHTAPHENEFSDFDMRIVVHSLEGTTGGACGITFRRQNGDNFYLLNLDAVTGTFLLQKLQAGEGGTSPPGLAPQTSIGE